MTLKEENIVNIAMAAAGMIQGGKIKVEDHMALTQDIISLAEKFEKEYAGVDYNASVDELRGAGKPVRDYWEDIDTFAEKELLERYGERQHKNEKSYEFLQLKRDEIGDSMLFLNMEQMERYGFVVNEEYYNKVYSGPVAPEASSYEILNDLWTKFNIDHPKDFKGHSMSVSDVIVLNDNGKKTAYFCDRAGFEEVPGFFEPQHAETLEQLAADLDEFSFNADPYEYKDNYDNREAGLAVISNMLSQGKTEDIKNWLFEMIAEDRNSEVSKEARKLTGRIARFENALSKEKKVFLNEKISDAQNKETKPVSVKENGKSHRSRE